MQAKEKEEKAELLGVNKVSKTCIFRSPSHTEKAVVPYNLDIKLLFTTMVVPAVGYVLQFQMIFPSLVPLYTLHVPLQSFPPLFVIPAGLDKERDKARVILLHVSE